MLRLVLACLYILCFWCITASLVVSTGAIDCWKDLPRLRLKRPIVSSRVGRTTVRQNYALQIYVAGERVTDALYTAHTGKPKNVL